MSLADVEGFGRAWRKGGANGNIVVLLDQTTKEFARDFANIVLKSFIIDQVNKAKQAQMRQAQAPAPKIIEG